MGATRVWTRNLTAGNSFTIVAAMQALAVSFQMSGATGDAGTITGDYTIRNAAGNADLASQALAIPENGGQTITSIDPQKPVDGVTLACTQGTMKIVMYF